MSYLALGVPGFDQFASYQNVRRATLNFEAVGGERYSQHDLASQRTGQLIQFPSKIAKKVIVRIHRKESRMNDESQQSSTLSGEPTEVVVLSSREKRHSPLRVRCTPTLSLEAAT